MQISRKNANIKIVYYITLIYALISFFQILLGVKRVGKPKETNVIPVK